jgi:hypothetical protein
MGLSFHSTGCVKGAKECWNESHTLNGSARAAKIKEKPAGLGRQVLVNFFAVRVTRSAIARTIAARG